MDEVNVAQGPAGGDAEGARGRGRGRTRSAAGGSAPPRGWIYDEERITAVTAARRAEQKAMARLRRRRPLPDGVPADRSSTIRAPSRAAAARTAPSRSSTASSTATSPSRPSTCSASGRSRSSPASPPRPPSAASRRSSARSSIEPGRALSLLNDAAWGRLVVQGKFKDEHFADELVEAAAALIKNWGPKPAPEWVTAVPSLRHPELVPDFAERLAKAIDLPYSQRWSASPRRSRSRASSRTRASST